MEAFAELVLDFWPLPTVLDFNNNPNGIQYFGKSMRRTYLGNGKDFFVDNLSLNPPSIAYKNGSNLPNITSYNVNVYIQCVVELSNLTSAGYQFMLGFQYGNQTESNTTKMVLSRMLSPVDIPKPGLGTVYGVTMYCEHTITMRPGTDDFTSFLWMFTPGVGISGILRDFRASLKVEGVPVNNQITPLIPERFPLLPLVFKPMDIIKVYKPRHTWAIIFTVIMLVIGTIALFVIFFVKRR